jgi:hypothetical protein
MTMKKDGPSGEVPDGPQARNGANTTIMPPPRPPEPAEPRVRRRKDAEERHREQQERLAALRAADPLWDFPLLKAQALVGATAIEAVAVRPVVYLWEGIVTPGNTIILGGPPGDGKTTALMLMVAARRNVSDAPTSIFGRAMKPAPHDKWLVVIEDEQSDSLTSRQLVRSCKLLGLPTGPGGTLERVIVLARREVTLGSPQWLEVCELTKRGAVDSIWIDSLTRFQAGGDSNDADDQAAVFACLQATIESAPGDAKPTIWILAHTRKPKHARDKLTLSDLAGSVQRAAQIDVAIILQAERDESENVTSSTVTFPKVRDRGDEPIPACTLIIECVDGERTLMWKTGAAVKASTAEGAQRSTPDSIYELLRSGGELTENAIAKALHMGKRTVAAAIGVLLRDKRIRKREAVVKGKNQIVFVAVQSFGEIFRGGDDDNA